MADVFNKTPAEFIDINTMFDVLNNRVGFEAEQLRAIVENTYWLYNYALEYHVPVDSAMSNSSTNPVQNKVIKAYVDTLGNTLTNTRKNAVRVKLASSVPERIDITPLEWSLSDTTEAEDCEISKLWLQTPTEYRTCHLKDATARSDIADLNTRVDALENAPDIDLSGYVTDETFNNEIGEIETNALKYTGYTPGYLNFNTLAGMNINGFETYDFSGIKLAHNNKRWTFNVYDSTAHENITALDTRTTALEEAIGDIGTLLDTINGEVV